MPALSVLGVAVLALQLVVGFGVYRYFAGFDAVPAVICGAVVTVVGVVALPVAGVVWTVVLDVAMLFTAAFVGARFDESVAPG